MSELSLSTQGKNSINVKPYSICYYPKFSTTGLGEFVTEFPESWYEDNRGYKTFMYKCSTKNQVGVQIVEVTTKSSGFSGMTGFAVLQMMGYGRTEDDHVKFGEIDNIQFMLPYIGSSVTATVPYKCKYTTNNSYLLDGNLTFNVAFGTGKAISAFVDSIVGTKQKIKVGPRDLTIPSAKYNNTLYLAICCEYSGSKLVSSEDNVRFFCNMGACAGNTITSSDLDRTDSIDSPFETVW